MYLFFIWFLEEPLFGAQAPSRCWRGRAKCVWLYRFHALSPPHAFFGGFWGIVLKIIKKKNTFQVCIEKHSSHSTHVDLERCISTPSTCLLSLTWEKKTKKKPELCIMTQTSYAFGFSFLPPALSPTLFFFHPLIFPLPVNAFCAAYFSLFFSEWLFFHVGCSCWKTNRM